MQDGVPTLELVDKSKRSNQLAVKISSSFTRTPVRFRDTQIPHSGIGRGFRPGG